MSEVQQDLLQVSIEEEAAAIGAQLRQAREARGETVSDVAQALKLTARQVAAMEAGRLEVLPGAAFARGFLRNYARHVGFDPGALLTGLDSAQRASAVELAPVSNAEGEMPVGGGATRPLKLPAGIIGLALVVLAAGWYFDWFRVPDESAAIADPVPTLLSAPDAANPPVDAAAPGEPQYSPAPMAPVEQASQPGAPADAVQPAPAAVPAPAAAAPAQASEPPAVAPGAPTENAAPEQKAATDVDHLLFRFSGESWVEVRDASGSIVYSGVNAAGSTRTIQGRAPFSLVIGNAREVSLEYRGQPFDLTPHIRVSVARVKVE